MSSLHYYHKTNVFSDIIVLVSSTIFQTYNIISCDASCDYGHMSLHCLRKRKRKRKRKNKIKKKEILNQEK